MLRLMDYRSPFSDWHAAAAVRAMPPGGWMGGREGEWMPEEAGGVLSHPALRGCRERVAAGLLLDNLGFTVALENRLICPVTRDIAAGMLRARYQDEVVTDAMRIQCDESYHAVLAQELIGQVKAMTGAQLPRREHRFLAHVDRLVDAFPAADAPMVRFCAAMVSETLITKTLRDDWLDGRLQQDLRSFLHHHYLDETRHSAYFARLLQLVWPQWPQSLRDALQPLWAGLVDAFLEADGESTIEAMQNAGLAPAQARAVMADCANPQGARRRCEASTQQTFHALRRAGALHAAPAHGAAARGMAR